MSSLAVRLHAGDGEAFAELYREFHPRVLGQCRYLLGSREEAEDAASEVFARLPRALRTYDSRQPFSNWLSRVVRHYCVDLLRKRQSQERVLEVRSALATEPAASAASP